MLEVIVAVCGADHRDGAKVSSSLGLLLGCRNSFRGIWSCERECLVVGMRLPKCLGLGDVVAGDSR